MAVLHLDGSPIDWVNPPKSTDRVQWSRKSQYGHDVTGSLFVIAWLDWVDSLVVAKWGVHVIVIQTAFNTGVDASEGTHDFDYCMDLWIPGVAGYDQQRFLRDHGGCFWYRQPWQGFTPHEHGFPMPPGGHHFPTKVGIYLDGGESQGRSGFSSQLDDYWREAYGLAGLHDQSDDPSYFPSDSEKMEKIFDLDAYINEQVSQMAIGYSKWDAEDRKEFWDDFANFFTVRPVVTNKKGTDTTKDDKVISIANAIQQILND